MRFSGESAIEKITLDGVRGSHVTLSATVHDVLYYMSPIYCQDIINSVHSLFSISHFPFSCFLFFILLFYSPIGNILFDHLEMLCL